MLPFRHHDHLLTIAREAADILLSYFAKQQAYTISYKSSHQHSPVTEADHAVSAFLEQKLGALGPSTVCSEENETCSTQTPSARFVDPLDGTKGFIEGEETFCIIIGKASHIHGAELGLLYFPCTGEYVYGEHDLGAIYRDGKHHTILQNTTTPLTTIYYKQSAYQIPVYEKVLTNAEKNDIPLISIHPTGFLFKSMLLDPGSIFLSGHGFTYELCAFDAILGGKGHVLKTINQNPINYFHKDRKIRIGIQAGTEDLLDETLQ